MQYKFNKKIKNGSETLINCCEGIEEFLEMLRCTEFEKNVYFPSLDHKYDNPFSLMGHFFKFTHAQYISKYIELLTGFIESANNRNYLLSSMCGRGIIECTATWRYFNNKSLNINRKYVEKHENREEDFLDKDNFIEIMDLINSHMRGSRFDWGKFFTSSKKDFINNMLNDIKNGVENKDIKKSASITKYLKSWDEDFPELRVIYDFFSDLIHPNFGSNLLLTGIDGNKIQVGEKSNKAVGKNITKESIMLLTPCIREASIQVTSSILLASLGDKIDK